MIRSLTIRDIARMTRLTPSQVADQLSLQGIDTEITEGVTGLTDLLWASLDKGEDVLVCNSGAKRCLSMRYIPSTLSPAVMVGEIAFYSTEVLHQTHDQSRDVAKARQLAHEATINPPSTPVRPASG